MLIIFNTMETHIDKVFSYKCNSAFATSKPFWLIRLEEAFKIYFFPIHSQDIRLINLKKYGKTHDSKAYQFNKSFELIVPGEPQISSILNLHQNGVKGL